MTAVTRAMVLEAAAGLRTGEPSTSVERATDQLLRDIITATVQTRAGDLVDYTAYPTSEGSAVTGVLIDVSLARTDSVQTRSLATVALASTVDGEELDGSIELKALPRDAASGVRVLSTSSLSGDVHVTAPVDTSTFGVLRVTLPSVADEPAQIPPAPSPTPRTAAELAAARRTYDAARKTARTKYAKARRKAGRSKRRRAIAKKSYDTRRARAKAAYRAAIADVPPAATGPITGAPQTSEGADPSTIISTDVGWSAPAR